MIRLLSLLRRLVRFRRRAHPVPLSPGEVSATARVRWGTFRDIQNRWPRIPCRDPDGLPNVEYRPLEDDSLAYYDVSSDSVHMDASQIRRQLGDRHLETVAAHEYGHAIALPRDFGFASEMDFVARRALGPDVSRAHRHLAMNLFDDVLINVELHRLDRRRPSAIADLFGRLGRGNRSRLFALYLSLLHELSSLRRPRGLPAPNEADLRTCVQIFTRCLARDPSRAVWLDGLHQFATVLRKYFETEAQTISGDRFGTGGPPSSSARSSAGPGARSGPARKAAERADELQRRRAAAERALSSRSPSGGAGAPDRQSESALDVVLREAGGHEGAAPLLAEIEKRLERQGTSSQDTGERHAERELDRVRREAARERARIAAAARRVRDETFPAARKEWDEREAQGGPHPSEDPSVRRAIRRADLPLLDAAERLESLAAPPAQELARSLDLARLARIHRAVASLQQTRGVIENGAFFDVLLPLQDAATRLAPDRFAELVRALGLQDPSSSPRAGGPHAGSPSLANRLQYLLLAHRRLTFPPVPLQPPAPRANLSRSWDIDHPVETYDARLTLQEFGPLPRVPGESMRRPRPGRPPTGTPGTHPECVPIDLEVWVDSSGSMPNPVLAVVAHTVAALVAALSALATGASVRVVNFSGADEKRRTGYRVLDFSRDPFAVADALLTYFGGGTVLPLDT
ncbi:MAG: hypothetical protein HY720_31065, partial [Planctomycetes bacterium]|nr:hypothetical protein [Planctomycetota bacterium]